MDAFKWFKATYISVRPTGIKQKLIKINSHQYADAKHWDQSPIFLCILRCQREHFQAAGDVINIEHHKTKLN